MPNLSPVGPPRLLIAFAQSDTEGAEPQPVRSLIPLGVPPEEALSAFIEALSIDYGKSPNDLIAGAVAAREAARQDLPTRTSVFRKGRSQKLNSYTLKSERDEINEERSLVKRLLRAKMARNARGIAMPRLHGSGRRLREDAEWLKATHATFNQLQAEVSARLALPTRTSVNGACRDAILFFRPGMKSRATELKSEAKILQDALRYRRSLG